MPITTTTDLTSDRPYARLARVTDGDRDTVSVNRAYGAEDPSIIGVVGLTYVDREAAVALIDAITLLIEEADERETCSGKADFPDGTLVLIDANPSTQSKREADGRSNGYRGYVDSSFANAVGKVVNEIWDDGSDCVRVVLVGPDADSTTQLVHPDYLTKIGTAL